MGIKAVLLTDTPASGRGLFVRVDELADESKLTENHLPAIAECDLPAGRYVWIPAKSEAERQRFPAGGSFVDQAALERRNRPDSDLAFAGLCSAVEGLGGKLPDETRAYLKYLGQRRARRGKKGAG